MVFCSILNPKLSITLVAEPPVKKFNPYQGNVFLPVLVGIFLPCKKNIHTYPN